MAADAYLWDGICTVFSWTLALAAGFGVSAVLLSVLGQLLLMSGGVMLATNTQEIDLVDDIASRRTRSSIEDLRVLQVRMLLERVWL